MNATNVSRACTDLIKSMEGCELTAYLDRIAKPPVWTIGFGDTLGVRQGMTITMAQAEASLKNRLANEFVPGVLLALKGSPVTQSQLDAMVSFAWNVGVGAFRGSSVCRLHNDGHYAEAAHAFLLWNQAGGEVIRGLVRRREAERALYLKDAIKVEDHPRANELAHQGPVLAIQEVLVNAGVLRKGGADGDFFKETKAALNALLVKQPRGKTLDQIPNL